MKAIHGLAKLLANLHQKESEQQEFNIPNEEEKKPQSTLNTYNSFTKA